MESSDQQNISSAWRLNEIQFTGNKYSSLMMTKYHVNTFGRRLGQGQSMHSALVRFVLFVLRNQYSTFYNDSNVN